jgi:hypothetical protein
VRNANISGGSESAASAHATRRNSKGVVPKGLQTGGQFKRAPISISDKNRQITKKMNRAGMAKAAWLDASRKSSKSLKIAKFFWGKLKNGSVNRVKSGLKREVWITNSVPYINALTKPSDIKVATDRAYKAMYLKMKRKLEK